MSRNKDKDKKNKKPKGSWVGSLVRKDDADEMERKARKKAGKQEKKQAKKVKKMDKKERKAEAKLEKHQEAAAVQLRASFDQFIYAHRPTRRPGTHWEYLDIKTPETLTSQPIIFLPPGALRPEACFEFLVRAAQRFRVVAVVFPGDFTSLADYVAGVELILSHASISKAHFVGVGFGGFVAHQLLTQRSDLFLSLTLAFSSPPDPEFGKIVRRFARGDNIERSPELFPYFTGFGEKFREETEADALNSAELVRGGG